MDLIELIKNRRTIRKFTDYYVSDKELKELIEAARFAPSWANTQIWDFIIIRDRELVEKVTETYSSTNPARKGSLTISALIACCAKKGVSGCRQGEQETKFAEWFMFDLGMAVQNLCLRAHELGLGSVVVGNFDHNQCRELLRLPDEFEVVAMIPVGKPMDIEVKVPSRKELHEFVHLNIYGEKYGNLY